MAAEDIAATQFMNRFYDAFAEGDPEVERKALEKENVKTISEAYGAIATKDPAKLRNLFSEEVELEIVGPDCVPFRGRWSGASEVTEAIWKNFSMVESQKPELISLTAQGDLVVILGKEQGKYLGSGQSYRYTWVQFFTCRDGKIHRFREVVATDLP